MTTEDMFAETFQQIPGKTNILGSSHDGLWEIYQLEKIDHICKISCSAPV